MSASHNPGGPEYDWGIKVVYLFILYVLQKLKIDDSLHSSVFNLAFL